MAFLLSDSEVLWLNITNAALGVVVLICCLVVIGAVAYQFALPARRRKRALQQADGDMRVLFDSDDHAFQLPKLGLTMADGGERTDKPKGK